MTAALPLLKIGGVLGGVLGAAALLAWGVGYSIGKISAVYKDGVAACRTEMALAYEEASREARDAAEAAMKEAEAEQGRLRADAEKRASEAERRASDALALLRRNNANLDRCLREPYPDSVRRHLPASLRLDG